MTNVKKKKRKPDCVGRFLIKKKERLLNNHKTKEFKKAKGPFNVMGHMFEKSPHVSTLIDSNKTDYKTRSLLDRDQLDEYIDITLSKAKSFLNNQDVAVLMKQLTTKNISKEFDQNNLFSIKDMYIPIPRRPIGFNQFKIGEEHQMTTEELNEAENNSFLQWRLSLAEIEEKEGIILTPFEKNLEYWRQLWRTLEKGNIVFQILDCRDPCFFRCADLESYSREIHNSKLVILILNKSDLVPIDIRKMWCNYFNSEGVLAFCYSGLNTTFNKLSVEEFSINDTSEDDTLITFDSLMSLLNNTMNSESIFSKQNQPLDILTNLFSTGRLFKTEEFIDVLKFFSYFYDANGTYIQHTIEEISNQIVDLKLTDDITSSTEYHEKKKIKRPNTNHNNLLYCSFVGFPNVGKSTIINNILGEKRVAISRQPGKTKHFQTLYLPNTNIVLCDCPGLIFPRIVNSKSDLILNGVSCIDSLKLDILTPIQYICNQIPYQLIDTYNVPLKELKITNDNLNSENLKLEATLFLTNLAKQRGKIAGGKGGIPHIFQVGKMILHDYNCGKLLHWTMPHKQTSTKQYINDQFSPANIHYLIQRRKILTQSTYDDMHDIIDNSLSVNLSNPFLKKKKKKNRFNIRYLSKYKNFLV